MNGRYICSTIVGVISLSLLTEFCTQAQVKLIRQDRIWEYRGNCYELATGRVFHTAKFTDSIEVNNKIYHIFERLSSVYCTREGKAESGYSLTLDSIRHFDGNGQKYFVREEGRKVFALTQPGRFCVTYDKFSEIDPEKLQGCSETLIYDFGCEDGAIIPLPVTEGYSFTKFDDMKIIHIGSAEVDGEECRYSVLVDPVFYISDQPSLPHSDAPEFPYDISLHTTGWIEGIGIVRHGCLAAYQAFLKSNWYNDNSEFLHQESKLRSVYTKDGRVIYGATPFSAGVKVLQDSQLSIRNSDGRILASGSGNVTLTVMGLDGMEVASVSGAGEAALSTTSLVRGVYVVTASDGATKRVMKIQL